MNRSDRHCHRRPLAFICPARTGLHVGSAWRRIGALAAAVPLILVGTALILTPAPGGVLIGGGLALLGREFRATRRLLVAVQWRVRCWRRDRALASARAAH